MVILLGSCGTGQLINTGNSIEHEEMHSSDEASSLPESVETTSEKINSTPAADRGSQGKIVKEENDQEANPLVAETNSAEKIEGENGKKNKRVSKRNKRSKVKEHFRAMKNMIKEKSSNNSSDATLILLVILAIFIAWLSVGIYTNWDVMLTVITLILWLLFILPGFIFALLVLFDVVG
jgi:Flp pilus assembly protein TadB